MFKQGEKGIAGGHGSEYSQIALTILEDALGDQASALKTHEYFSRRVGAQFPERWTISRSRVLAYVNMIEHEQRAGLGAADTLNTGKPEAPVRLYLNQCSGGTSRRTRHEPRIPGYERVR